MWLVGANARNGLRGLPPAGPALFSDSQACCLLYTAGDRGVGVTWNFFGKNNPGMTGDKGVLGRAFVVLQGIISTVMRTAAFLTRQRRARNQARNFQNVLGFVVSPLGSSDRGQGNGL